VSNDDLDQELRDLVTAQELVARLVAALHAEVFDPAQALFGDRASAWIADTLRVTANVVERLDLPDGQPPAG
jgi:hypothetical protein